MAILIITSALAVGALGALGGTAALAATGETAYPNDGELFKTLVFSSLDDYATDGKNYAFLDGGKLITVIDGEYRDDYAFTPTALDYAEGAFYYATSSGIYSLEDNAEAVLTFQDKDQQISLGGYLYYFDGNGQLTIYNLDSKQTKTLESGYGKLKKYAGSAYAVWKNVLYRFDEDTPREISLIYTDFSPTEKISVGQTADALVKDYSLKFVTIKEGAYVTEVNLTKLDGQYFEVKNTHRQESDATALLLAYTGNAAIVAVGDIAYITLNTSVTETAVDCYTEAGFDFATVTGTGIYASPYAANSTAALDSALGTKVNVTHKLVLDGVLSFTYYEVEYKVGSETKVGYVAEGFLSAKEYIDNEEPKEITPEYSEKNDIKKMVLIFAVVVLVLIAVGYLAYIGTSGKNKKKKKEQPKDEDNDSQ